MKWVFIGAMLLLIGGGGFYACERAFIGLPPTAGPALSSITVNLQHPGNPGFVPPANSGPALPAH